MFSCIVHGLYLLLLSVGFGLCSVPILKKKKKLQTNANKR